MLINRILSNEGYLDMYADENIHVNNKKKRKRSVEQSRLKFVAYMYVRSFADIVERSERREKKIFFFVID